MITKEIQGYQMHLDPNDGGIAQSLIQNGGREAAFMHVLREEVKDGMVCLDLGANIGYTTLPMVDRVGATGHVYAVEPDPHNLSFLTRNLIANGFTLNEVSVMPILISDHSGESEFWIASHPNLNSVAKTKHSIRKMDVECWTLTDLVKSKSMQPPNFIKMDVEGHEVEILLGAQELFMDHSFPCSILLEVHPQFYDEDHSFADVLGIMSDFGFECKYVVSTPVAQPALFREAGYTPAETFHTDGFVRGLYTDVSWNDMVDFACWPHDEGTSKKIVRSLMISRS